MVMTYENQNVFFSDQQGNIPTEKWMERLVYYTKSFKTKKLYEITMPGSHDAATYTMSNGLSLKTHFTVTQIKTLKEQFEAGVRYFDIRFQIPKRYKLSTLLGKNHHKISFTHGGFTSSSKKVYPEMMNFLQAIMSSREIVILKIHTDKAAYKIFCEQYLTPELKKSLISPAEFESSSIKQLIENDKRILITTRLQKKAGNDTDISIDYKSRTNGKWADTHDLKKLYREMNKVRHSEIDYDTRTINEALAKKLKIIQTNEPGAPGFHKSVLEADTRPESRNVTERFIQESKQQLVDALNSADLFKIKCAKLAVRGVISMDNIGSDRGKDQIISSIIELNQDDEVLFLSR